MEAPLLTYLIKANGALLIFYLLYVVVFRRDTFLRLRRIYWLWAMVFPTVYPFFIVESLRGWGFFLSSQKGVEPTILLGNPALSVVRDTAPGLPLPWGTLAACLLALGSLFFALRLVIRMVSVVRIQRRCNRRIVSGCKILDPSREITPFSFFKWIVLNPESHSEKELHQIILHESTHARQWHSVDMLLAELLSVLFWWNPAVWLLKREMNVNLEHLADNDVLRHGVDTKEYQYHLLKLTCQPSLFAVGNNFNVSQLKRRIMMMNKTKSPARRLSRYLAIVPLSVLLIAANSCFNEAKNKESGEATSSTETTVAPPVDSLAAAPEGKESIKEEVFVVVEKQPLFPGGSKAMMKFLSDNIEYPPIARDKGIEGRVILNFIVEKDGSLSDVKVVRGIDPSLDKEALRVIRAMPEWTPGKQRGKEVRVRFTLPVIFRLQNPGKTSSSRTPPPASAPVDGKGSEDAFVVVEKQPLFPGGNKAMMKFLSDNIKYPPIARDKGIEGRVILNFIVEKDGSLSDVKVVRSIDPSLDKEALRVIRAMPEWTPGKQRGKEVRVRFTLPVVFKLTNSSGN